MTIAIDVSSIVYGTGVSVYTQELVQALSQIDTHNQYLLFGGSFRQTSAIKTWFTNANLGANFQLKTIPIPPRLQTLLWNDLHILPLEWLLGQKIDLYHSVDWSLAPTQARTILTVHDLFFLKHPDLQLHPYRATLERRLRRARQQNLPVIAVSQATKHDLTELLNYPDKLITVVYEAARSDFRPLTDQTLIEKTWDKYQLHKKYLLMVSTLEPRKNLPHTLEAFKRLSTQLDVELVIAGKIGWGEQLPRVKAVKLLGYVHADDIQVLLAGAQALIYPSLYEGFGIPILEAMVTGVPVLTSRVSSMPEVAGDAAIYVNPDDVDSIRSAMEKVLSLKPAQRQQLIDRGFQQAKKFSWQKAATQTLKLYQTL